MSVPKITEIMHAIYQGLSKKRLCKEYFGGKVNNTQGLIRAEVLHLHVLPSSPQSNNLARSRDPIENTLAGQRSTSRNT